MNKIKNLLISIALILSISLASAAADFDVNTFSCTPSEVAINEVFSCTAQIKNNGDTGGAVNNLRLYPDSNAWMEQTSYLQTSGANVNPGQTTEVTFSGLRGTKSGNNGFTRISLDNEDDTWVADNNVKINVIDVSVTTANSASSKASGQTFTTTPEITAGGGIDVTLTLTVDSGGCGIGNQASQKSTTGLTNGQKWTPSAWTVTMGSSGDCAFTLSASATGSNGIATKTSSTSKTVTCSSGCSSGGGGSSGGSSGGSAGAGGGIGTQILFVGELKESIQQEIGKNENMGFSFGGENHSVSITNLTETTASIVVRSTEKRFVMTVGEEKNVDFNDDGKEEISLKLKSINIIRKKALLIVTPLYLPSKEKTGESSGADGEKESEKKEISEEKTGGEDKTKKKISMNWVIIFLIGIGIIAIGIAIIKIYLKRDVLRRAVRVKDFKSKNKPSYSSKWP